MQSEEQAHPWLGTMLAAIAAIAYSTSGYFTRLLDLDVPTVLFWRGLYAGLFMSACIVLMYGRKTVATVRNIGFAGLLVAILSAAATVCYLNALRLTTVAEVMAINATSPFITGILAWLFIGERERWPVLLASLFALAGVVIMVGPGALTGHFAGAVLGFMQTFFIALMIVIMRLKKSVSMLPASCLSAYLSSIVVWPVSSAAIPTGVAMLQLALFGIVQFGLGLIFLTLGARHIGALRSSLLARLQTVLGPLWVWLAFSEVPPLTTMIGGLIVLASTIAASLVGQEAHSPAYAGVNTRRWKGRDGAVR
jgi:drug/metabolite transporter (DMT)-like permease